MSGPDKEKPNDPHLIVGVDFGLTGTAVAWALPSKEKVESIRTWPGTDRDAGKVPSAVVLEGLHGASAWGFSTQRRDLPQHLVYSLFKAPVGIDDQCDGHEYTGNNANVERQVEGQATSHVDPDEEMDEDFQLDNIMSLQKAKECLKEYLTSLYVYIKDELSAKFISLDWSSTRAWFLFSYPTTWSPSSIERFNRIVKASGFGQERHHWVNASYMDEAQAAMASFSIEGSRPAPGKVIVIADIGGGTTDVNTYSVKGDDGRQVQLNAETEASGRNHGSVHVDARVTNLLRAQVKHTLIRNSTFKSKDLNERRLIVKDQTASILKECGYLTIKHGLDRDTPTIREELYPIFLSSSGPPDVKVTFGMHEALRKEFEKECQKIWDQIEEHLKTRPEGTVDQLVLTGGMSKSALVRNWFKKKAIEARMATKPIRETIFLSEPELAVSRGLVHDALESYKREGLWRYRSLHSYGIVVYSGGTVEMKRKFLSKNQVIAPKKFKEKQTIRFKLAGKSHADLQLARWDNDSDNNNNIIVPVGSLTTGLPEETEWESSWGVGSDAKTEVELTFERRTAIVKFWSKGRKPHRLVFNEEWHSTTDQSARRRQSSRILRHLKGVTEVLGILGAISSIIVIGLDFLPGGGNDTDGGDPNGRANHAAAEDNGDNGGIEEGVGQFDNFEEE